MVNLSETVILAYVSFLLCSPPVFPEMNNNDGIYMNRFYSGAIRLSVCTLLHVYDYIVTITA